MRRIASCNHTLFACLREHNFFINEPAWLIPQKQQKTKEVFFYEVQL